MHIALYEKGLREIAPILLYSNLVCRGRDPVSPQPRIKTCCSFRNNIFLASFMTGKEVKNERDEE